MEGNWSSPCTPGELVLQSRAFSRLATQPSLTKKPHLPLGQCRPRQLKPKLSPCSSCTVSVPASAWPVACASPGMSFSSLSLGSSCLPFRPAPAPTLTAKPQPTGSFSLAVSTALHPQPYILPLWGVPCQPVSMLCSGKQDAGQAPAFTHYSPTPH